MRHWPENRGGMEDVPYIFRVIQVEEGSKMVPILVKTVSFVTKADMKVEVVPEDVTSIKFKSV